MLKIQFCVVFLFLMHNLSIAQFTRSYPYVLELESSLNLRLYWNITGNKFLGALEANTAGWAGFGFSPSPYGMTSADILIAYTYGSSNTPFVGDYWAFGDLTPSLDASQDWTLVAGSRSGNTLRVEFERLLQTGDTTRDRVISPCTPTPIIWATGAAVPVTPDTPQQHSFATVGGIQSYRFCISCTSPSAPQNVQIVSSGSNWVVVSWTAPASTGGVPIESYLVTAVPRGGADLISRTIPATSLRTNLTNLPSSTTFSIAVQASHCLGGSDLSSEVSYTSLAAPPSDPLPPTLPPQKAPVQAPQASLYSSEVSVLNGEMIVRWGVPENSDTIFFQLEGKTNGWVGIGHGGRLMNNADIVMGYVEPNGNVFVGDFWAVGESTPIPDTTRGGKSSIFDVKGTQANGVTKISFARNLTTGDSQDVAWIIGANDIIVALSDIDNFDYHTLRGTARLQINRGSAGSGIGGDSSAATPARIAHGVLMVFGWAELSLIGVLVARYGKVRFPAPSWFKHHMYLQIFGFVVTIVGLVVVLATNTSHFTTRWHSQLGIAVMVGALLQLIMGLMRPDAPKNLKEKKTGKRNAFEWIHGTFGKLLIIASIIAIFSGLVQMGVPLFGIIIFAVYIGLAVAAAIVLEIIKCRRESQK